MKSKFNIGDEIFFMQFGEPAKSTVKGISFVVGTVETHNSKQVGTETEPKITYGVNGYSVVEEEKAYGSATELKNALFAKLI